MTKVQNEDDVATRVGEVQHKLTLKGSVILPSGESAAAALWLSDSGLWLVDTAAGTPQLAIDVLQRSPLRYVARMLGDRLVVGTREFGIPTGSGGHAREMIALARLRAAHDKRFDAALLQGSPFMDPSGVLERTWLAQWLASEEQPLAWLGCGSDVEVPSPHGSKEKVPQRWLLTDRRSALVAVGPLGDVQLIELPLKEMTVAAGLGRCDVRVGGTRWLTTLTNAADYRVLAASAGYERPRRWREVARVVWHRSGKAGAARDWARRLLQQGAEQDPWAALSFALTDDDPIDDDNSTAAQLDALAALSDAHRGLADWAEGWGWSPEKVRLLAERFTARGHHRCAAALHEHHWAVTPIDDKQPFASAQRDYALAMVMAAAGERMRAAELLDAALAALPSPDVLVLVPHIDVTDEGGPLHMRLRLLDAMVDVLGEPEQPHLPSLLAIAQLFPLHVERVAALVAASDGDLKRRAQALLACLKPSGLENVVDDDLADAATHAWSSWQVEQLLRHPAARSDGAFGKLQAMLAEVQVPDHSALKSYCQRLEEGTAPHAHAALQHAVTALAAPPLGAYVSRGDKSVSIRAFEGPAPFLLIGGDHLVFGKPVHLSPREMAFGIATEVAHVRFGHARVTSSDLWRGAFEKGKSTLNLALGVMPALKMFKLGRRLAALAEHLKGAPVGLVVGAATRLWPRAAEDVSDPSISRGYEQLVAAHRVTQFTADRAGLLLAGQLRASLRAMFILSPSYQPELAAAVGKGLSALLAQRTQEGSLRFADLAARIGALASFSLSEEYATLRDSLASPFG